MGASIRVKWLEGPASDEVRRVAGAFAGADFDGMTDSRIQRPDQIVNGELVRFGVHYVFVHRNAGEES